MLVIALSACAGGDDAAREDDRSRPTSSVDESKPALHPDGPSRGLVLARGIDEQGSVIDPRLAFTIRNRQATAVIGLGSDAPEGTLTVAWYRLTGIDERKHLFSHGIAVGPGQLAYSQGVAAGGLAPGLYETVATLGKRQVRTPWVVRRRGSAETASARAGDGAEEVALVASKVHQRLAQTTLEPWEIPGPGESGVWDGELPPAPEGGAPDTCTVDSINSGLTPMTDVHATAWWLGPCSTLTLTATVSGPPAVIATDNTLSGVFSGVRGQADVCALPGGSDLPGTVVRFEATGSATAREDYTLPDLGESLTAGLEAIPAAGSKVAAGDRIKLHAIALVMPPAQGIKVLYVDDGSDLIESVGNVSGSEQPISCDLGRYFAQLVSEYRVPADPPPIIEICANAEGFDGTGSRDCIEFYTGEVWEGTLVWDALPDPRGTITYRARLVVDASGRATGRLDYVSCSPSCGPPPQTIAVEAERTESGFTNITFPDDGFRHQGSLSIAGDRAEGKTTYPISGFTYRHVWSLTCVTC